MTYLKVGDWDVHVNGARKTLVIRRIDEIGRLTGALFDQPIVGWWSERACASVDPPGGGVSATPPPECCLAC